MLLVSFALQNVIVLQMDHNCLGISTSVLDVSVVQTQHLSIPRAILLQLPVMYKTEKFLLCLLVSCSSS